MDKGNEKKLTTKNSLKNIKNKKKSLKIKQSLIASARTPRSGGINIDLKKYPIEKFKSIKSIPTITYRDIQTTIFPSELHENQQNYSYLNHTECRLESDLEEMKQINIKRLLSDRRLQKSSSKQQKKDSFLKKSNQNLKLKKPKQNATKQIIRKDRTKERRNTTLNIGSFDNLANKGLKRPIYENIVKRTSQLLVKYKIRQDEWIKQKQLLLKELQKYKRKINGKSVTTTTSSHNSQSHKLLF